MAWSRLSGTPICTSSATRGKRKRFVRCFPSRRTGSDKSHCPYLLRKLVPVDKRYILLHQLLSLMALKQPLEALEFVSCQGPNLSPGRVYDAHDDITVDDSPRQDDLVHSTGIGSRCPL